MIGIIGAMEIEVMQLVKAMADTSQEKISGITYFLGRLNSSAVVIAKCGVGKVNAAVCAQTMILKYAPEMMINIGVAGSLSPAVSIGEIVLGDYAVQYDFDTSALGDPVGLTPEVNLVKMPCADNVLQLLQKAAARLMQIKCHVGTVATGDQFLNAPDLKKKLASDFSAIACEMEGASICQVCLLNGVPFGLVRAISDNADDDSDVDFNTFMRMAAAQSTALLLALMEELN